MSQRLSKSDVEAAMNLKVRAAHGHHDLDYVMLNHLRWLRFASMTPGQIGLMRGLGASQHLTLGEMVDREIVEGET